MRHRAKALRSVRLRQVISTLRSRCSLRRAKVKGDASAEACGETTPAEPAAWSRADTGDTRSYF